MSPEQIVTIIVAVLQTGGLAYYFTQVIRGLKEKVVSLEQTIAAQNQTLKVMERQVSETEKIGRIYKNLFSELPKDLDNYKAIISRTKDDIIIELQNANKQKDERLKELAQTEKQLSIAPTADMALHMETMRFLVEPKHEHFRKFVENICGDIDAAIVVLIATRDFSKFLETEGKTLQIEDDKQKFEELWKSPVEHQRLRFGSHSMTGWHGIFDDSRIVMNTSEKNHFIASCRSLKARLDAHG